jgi:hypothetical protein
VQGDKAARFERCLALPLGCEFSSSGFMKTRAAPNRVPLSLKQFYTRSLFLPFAVMLLGFLLFLIGFGLPSPQPRSTVAGVGGLLSLVGFYSVVPYCVFLILAWPLVLSRQSGPVLGRLSWLVPPIIAIGITMFLVVGALVQGGSSPFQRGLLFVWAGVPLIVGYIYVVIIQLARVIATRAGWVRDSASSSEG